MLIGAILTGTIAWAVTQERPIINAFGVSESYNLYELWRAGERDALIAAADEALETRPMQPDALALRGFARFYAGMASNDTQERETLLGESIADLRRALLVDNPPMRGELHYILGKAYFHRGPFFYDLAVEELRESMDRGLRREDMFEYLAVASVDLGRSEEAVGYLQEALEVNPTAILYHTLGTTLLGMDRFDEAERALEEAVALSDDSFLLEQSRLTLGDIYRITGDLDRAEGQYRMVLEENSRSADAHFALGEVYYERGDNESARFEWREAFRIDPNHLDALQRLQDG
ncbi:MAG: tetratricopeptide repeat protein [Spirochaetaceae bacterium]